MTDLQLNFGAQPDERPGDDDAREARHQVLATLLGAYADGELPPETSSQIDAHLLGCVRCRREVGMHTAMRVRLSEEPTVTASAVLRERIMQQIARTPGATVLADVAAAPARRPWWVTRSARASAAVAIGLSIALVAYQRAGGEAGASAAALASIKATEVPLFSLILADYRRVTAGDLPGRARDLDAVRASVPFPVEVLHDPSLRLLGAWSTDLGGEPAAVLAYRWHDRLVLQYLIAEPVFFRHPGMRAPVAAGRLVTASSGSQGMLAWAAPESGAVLIGEVPAAELAALRVGGGGR
jgi:anti-sigma factor RsiW